MTDQSYMHSYAELEIRSMVVKPQKESLFRVTFVVDCICSPIASFRRKLSFFNPNYGLERTAEFHNWDFLREYRYG